MRIAYVEYVQGSFIFITVSFFPTCQSKVNINPPEWEGYTDSTNEDEDLNLTDFENLILIKSFREEKVSDLANFDNYIPLFSTSIAFSVITSAHLRDPHTYFTACVFHPRWFLQLDNLFQQILSDLH